MNERIRGLAEQACFKNQDEESITYFAELIVKECAHVAVFKNSGTVATAAVAGHIAAGRSMAAKLIKEHFGVEE